MDGNLNEPVKERER